MSEYNITTSVALMALMVALVALIKDNYCIDPLTRLDWEEVHMYQATVTQALHGKFKLARPSTFANLPVNEFLVFSC